MNTLEIPGRNLKISVPARYDEMTSAQVIYIMERLAEHRAGIISLDEFRVKILYKLCGIRRTLRSVIWAAWHPESPAQRYQRAEQTALLCDQLLGGILEKSGADYQIKFDSVRNFWPTVRIGWRRLVGPAEALLDLSFAEFRDATDEMQLYLKTKDEQHLDRMLACLYRPAGPLQPSGRHVVPYSADTLDKYAGLCHRFKPWQKQLVLLWFSACVKYMQTDRFIIGSQEICFAELFKSDTNTSDTKPSLGWMTVLYDLAEKRIFGDAEKTEQQGMIEILSLLYHYKRRNDATARKNR